MTSPGLILKEIPSNIEYLAFLGDSSTIIISSIIDSIKRNENLNFLKLYNICDESGVDGLNVILTKLKNIKQIKSFGIDITAISNDCYKVIFDNINETNITNLELDFSEYYEEENEENKLFELLRNPESKITALSIIHGIDFLDLHRKMSKTSIPIEEQHDEFLYKPLKEFFGKFIGSKINNLELEGYNSKLYSELSGSEEDNFFNYISGNKKLKLSKAQCEEITQIIKETRLTDVSFGISIPLPLFIKEALEYNKSKVNGLGQEVQEGLEGALGKSFPTDLTRLIGQYGNFYVAKAVSAEQKNDVEMQEVKALPLPNFSRLNENDFIATSSQNSGNVNSWSQRVGTATPLPTLPNSTKRSLSPSDMDDSDQGRRVTQKTHPNLR